MSKKEIFTAVSLKVDKEEDSFDWWINSLHRTVGGVIKKIFERMKRKQIVNGVVIRFDAYTGRWEDDSKSSCDKYT